MPKWHSPMGRRTLTKRNTFRGEWDAINKFAKQFDVKVNLKFDEFKEMAARPCNNCQGTTPGYAGNTLRRRPYTTEYNKESEVVCWPCLRQGYKIEGDYLRHKLRTGGEPTMEEFEDFKAQYNF